MLKIYFYGMKKKMKCSYCNNGTLLQLVNYNDFHFNGDPPIEEEVPCDVCNGTGYIKVIEKKKNKNKEIRNEINS